MEKVMCVDAVLRMSSCSRPSVVHGDAEPVTDVRACMSRLEEGVFWIIKGSPVWEHKLFHLSCGCRKVSN